jgi:hypothetical protein
MPLIRRLPKRGFNNAAFHKNYAVVNLRDLETFEGGSVVDENALRAAKLVRGNYHGIKLLGDGELKQGLTVQVDKISASARAKIEKAGGKITEPERKMIVARTQPPAEKAGVEPTVAKPRAKKVATKKAAPKKRPARK